MMNVWSCVIMRAEKLHDREWWRWMMCDWLSSHTDHHRSRWMMHDRILIMHRPLNTQ